jgi:predicted PurR-regulated permease PerM
MTTAEHQDRLTKIFVILLAIGISIMFFQMIRPFLSALLLAAIFSGMAFPVYRWFLKRFKERRAAASLATIAVVILVAIIPLSAFLGIVAAQAVEVTQSVAPWVEEQLRQPNELDLLMQRLPFYQQLEPYQDQIIAKVGEFASRIGNFLVNSVAAATRGTAWFMLSLFVVLYSMFFFLSGGRELLRKILYYMPLDSKRENLMVGKFVSVARATIKGTFVIGIVQGTLAGLGFYVAGIGSAAFWGTVMAVLSIIPGVGTAFIWVPGVVYLAVTGRFVAAGLLAVWCAVVVGTVDNILRPILVGRDTKLPDLLVLLSTLGGLILFGAVGFIIGPIVAALFVTVWEIYGEAFRDYLPEVSLPGDTGELPVPPPPQPT